MEPPKDIEASTRRTEDDDAPLPIFSIPNEITMLIFSFACHPSPIFCRNRRSGFNAEELSQYAREEGQELTISQVCQAWRSISHAYPELWSSFHYYSKYSRQYFTARLDTYLERAQSSLMALWVCFSTTEDVSTVFEMLRRANNSRWQKISLVFDRNYIREGKMGWVPPILTAVMYMIFLSSFTVTESLTHSQPAPKHPFPPTTSPDCRPGAST